MRQLRGPKHENWPVCDLRAAPPGGYGLKSGENGHLARANGAIDGPYCSPTRPSAFGRRCEPQSGRGGGFGGGAAPAPTRGAWGASSIRVPLRKTRGTHAPLRRCGGGPGREGWACSCSTVPGRGGRSKAAAFYNPQALSLVRLAPITPCAEGYGKCLGPRPGGWRCG
jgi:hypothetical protein